METHNIQIKEPIREAVIGSFHATLLPRKQYEVQYKTDVPIIGFSFETQQGIHSFASDKKSEFQARANSLAYLPAEYDVYSYSPSGGEYLTVKINDKHQINKGQRFNNVVNFPAIKASENIRRLLIASNPPSKLELENNIFVLQDQIRQNIKPSRASGWLTPRRLAIIDEIIENNLSDNLTVQYLADSLDLSTGFFTRAFKASIGKSPYSYIIDRRLYHARTLLKQENSNLSLIASICGFSSHAHMTTAFKQRLGITPSMIIE